MRKLFFFIGAAAVITMPVLGATIADFSKGPGRVGSFANKAQFAGGAAPIRKVVVDETAPAPQKVMLIQMPAIAEGRTYARCDLRIKLTPEEAAKMQAISFDLWIDKPETMKWLTIYLHTRPWSQNTLQIGNLHKGVTGGEWKHLELPLKSFRGRLAQEDVREAAFAFFNTSPVEIRVANIKLIEK